MQNSEAADGCCAPWHILYSISFGLLFTVGQRQVEGKALEEMRERGMEVNERTRAVLHRPADVLSKMQASKLRRLLDGGEQGAAWQLFDGLLDAGKAMHSS